MRENNGKKIVTKFGNILRITKFDEVPQLINVINNSMSFIGPRPLYLEFNNHYKKKHKLRLKIKPGITGLAQVQGRLDLSLQERLYWDIEYVENYNIVLDFKILFQTIISVISRKGAN